MRRALLALLLTIGGLASAQDIAFPLTDDAANTTVTASAGSNGSLAGGKNTDAVQTDGGPGGSFTKAFVFDGTNDYLVVSDLTTLNATFSRDHASAFSFALAFKTDDLTNRALCGNSSAFRHFLLLDATTFRFGTGGADFTVPTMSTGTWYHVMLTRANATTYRLFLNGVESSSGTVSPSATTFSPTWIGRSGIGDRWDGELSGIEFWTSDQSANAAAIYADFVDANEPPTNLPYVIFPSTRPGLVIAPSAPN